MLRQAVILAGGMGTRLGALTANTPKPLLKVGGQPFVEYLLKHLTRHGVEHIVLLVGPHESHYRQHFHTHSNPNVQVDFVSDVPPAGTGGDDDMTSTAVGGSTVTTGSPRGAPTE